MKYATRIGSVADVKTPCLVTGLSQARRVARAQGEIKLLDAALRDFRDQAGKVTVVQLAAGQTGGAAAGGRRRRRRPRRCHLPKDHLDCRKDPENLTRSPGRLGSDQRESEKPGSALAGQHRAQRPGQRAVSVLGT